MDSYLIKIMEFYGPEKGQLVVEQFERLRRHLTEPEKSCDELVNPIYYPGHKQKKYIALLLREVDIPKILGDYAVRVEKEARKRTVLVNHGDISDVVKTETDNLRKITRFKIDIQAARRSKYPSA